MKYIEELENGDSFLFQKERPYIITSDFRTNGSRLGICLIDGSSQWFKFDQIVDIEPIYLLDEDNQVIPVKPTKKHGSDIIIS